VQARTGSLRPQHLFAAVFSSRVRIASVGGEGAARAAATSASPDSAHRENMLASPNREQHPTPERPVDEMSAIEGQRHSAERQLRA